MKKTLCLLLALIFACLLTSAPAEKKAKPTATPAPIEIQADPAEPPELIARLLDVAHHEWEEVNGKDQGKKNKYTTWFNNYNWGKNKWCAGFVTWCMLEAGLPQMPMDELEELPEEAPEPVFHVKESAPRKMQLGYLHMHRTARVPQKGFIVLYGSGSNGYIHVGIVYDVAPLGNGRYRLTTLEGAMKNTVRKYIFDYDMNAEKKKNITAVPKDEQIQKSTKTFTYEYHKSGGTKWYINYFLMPWVPGEAAPEASEGGAEPTAAP